MVVVDDGGARNQGVRVGEFSLELVPPDESSGTAGSTKLLGKVWDGPVPESVRWDEQAKAEGCVLFTPRTPFCEESCGSAVCIDDNVCKAYPTALDVGAVKVAGVRTSTGESEFTSEPVNASYQLPVDLSLPYPAFEEGAALELAAAGGDLAPFTIAGTGIAPLVLEGSEEGFLLTPGEGLSLSWQAAGASAASRVHVKLDISHHGGSKGKIECDVEDDGSLTIPAALTDALVDLGVAGFPTVEVTRSSVSSVDTRVGRIELKTYMDVGAAILIPGLVSCSDPADCPEGETCMEGGLCG